ncbi:MAG: glycosyltransferase family 4 protein [Synechococcaceae cyanobacterium ELA445]
MLTFPLVWIVAAAIASWGLLRALIPLLRRSLLDQPNVRSSHRQPTPRGGGVAFVLISSLALPWQGSWIPLLCLPLALVGFLDDRHNLPAALRYGVQMATSLVLMLISPLPVLALGFLPWLLLLIAVTALINFTNFMDGLDGLVAGCMVVIFVVAALTGMSALWPLVGALAGFLIWNWSPATVFMGDVGSTFLGAVFAGVLLQQTSFQASLGLLLVSTPLLADASLCVPRRLLAGQNVFGAHRLHLFQRLHQAGWSHATVATTYIFATAVLGFALLAGSLPWVLALAVVVLFIGFWLDKRVAVPFHIGPEPQV